MSKKSNIFCAFKALSKKGELEAKLMLDACGSLHVASGVA